MVSRREILDRANVRYMVEFETGVEEADVSYRDHIRVVDSAGSYYDPIAKEYKLIWTEPSGEMPEDKGEVVYRSKKLNEIGVTRRKFSEGIRASWDDLRQPQHFELYAQDANGFGEQCAYTEDRWFWRFLLAGNSATYGTCYDGQFMFDTDHPGGTADGTPTTYSNSFTLALSENNLATVITAMMKYRTPSGRPYGNVWKSSTQMPQTSREARPSPGALFHLMVGPDLHTTAADLANMAQSDPSRYGGTFDFGIYQELEGADATTWFLKFHSAKRKPMAFVNGGRAMVSLLEGSENLARYDEAEWIARASFGYAYDKWHVMARSKP